VRGRADQRQHLSLYSPPAIGAAGDDERFERRRAEDHRSRDARVRRKQVEGGQTSWPVPHAIVTDAEEYGLDQLPEDDSSDERADRAAVY